MNSTDCKNIKCKNCEFYKEFDKSGLQKSSKSRGDVIQTCQRPDLQPKRDCHFPPTENAQIWYQNNIYPCGSNEYCGSLFGCRLCEREMEVQRPISKMIKPDESLEVTVKMKKKGTKKIVLEGFILQDKEEKS